MKWIGLSQRVCIAPGSEEVRNCLARDWTTFMTALKTPWVALPNLPDAAVEMAESLDLGGVVLTGGDDIGVFPERDATETALVEWCLQKARPVMGVCRGFQFLHVHFGGTLVAVTTGKHVAKRHVIQFTDQSTREVNSFHSFAPDFSALPPGYPLRKSAQCQNDGAVEAAVGENELLAGMMWHPERETTPDIEDMKWFRHHFAL